MRLRTDKNGDAVGRPRWESSFLGDPGAKFLRGKLGIGTERKKEHKASLQSKGSVAGLEGSSGLAAWARQF
jgi:hypothetical protein